MLILGIDTATRIASIGLTRDGDPLAEESRAAAANHTDTLLPLLSDLLMQAHVALTDIEGIGVSLGPGSFTGLRVALSTVQGFAYALGHKVVGVSTLEALARTVTDWTGTVCPLLDARKGEVYAAFFHRNYQGQVERLTPDQVCSPQAILRDCPLPCIFIGDGVETYGQFIQEQSGPAATLLPFTTHHARGSVVARMAWQRLRRGEYDNLTTLVPRYVRKPEAEFKRLS
jgi:tRNA threonylcarbamoyladenosine biosynthesis protein TsaB